MTRTSRTIPALGLGLALAACGSSNLAADSGPGVEAGVDAPAPTTATLHGVVTRSGTPAVDGIGGLYIALFDMDPVVAMDEASVVGSAFVPDVDMSAAGASIAYEMADIPPRAEPYFVIAFLDDNDSVTDPTAAAPDRGDLISLDGFAAPQVTLSEPTRVELDIDLTENLPF